MGRFILASNAAEVGGTGGSNTHTHTTSGSVTIGATTISTSQMPSHSHSTFKLFVDAGGGGWDAYANSGQDGQNGSSGSWTGTKSNGSSGSHTHTITSKFNDTGSANNIPAYYKLAYIMRVS